MSSERWRDRARGFSLVELLVVMGLILILSVLTFPMIHNMFQRSKLEGIARETSILMRTARLAAVKSGGLENFDPTDPARRSWRALAVVRLDLATQEIVAFVDLDGAGGAVGESDMIFNPRPGVPHKTTDYELGRFKLPYGIHFESPEEGTPGVDDLTENPGGPSEPNIAVFRPDGSIDIPGAFRFADERGNFLEVRAAPQATARIELRKHNGTTWLAQGEGGSNWDWKF